jgi:hypothetical protein
MMALHSPPRLIGFECRNNNLQKSTGHERMAHRNVRAGSMGSMASIACYERRL